MRLEIETSSYNNRRYGKPWIARVEFATGKGEFSWGEWVGRPGESGKLLLGVEPGDVIATGQKDHRNSRNGAAEYYIVQPDGTLGSEVTKAAAYDYFQHRQQQDVKPHPLAAFSDDELIAELERRGNVWTANGTIKRQGVTA